jgi:hypothetical protein
LPQLFAFAQVKVFLLIFILEQQQMNMPSVFQVQEEISKSATLSLPSTWIRTACFPQSPKSLKQTAALRILKQIGLDPAKHLVRCCPRQFLQPAGE